jgi:antitoxin (DNA-binding transcriptional repressor) of toxin-antitoxin stability system
METARVSIREFRTDLAQYISASNPVAVTRHSQTVGYFIPTLAKSDSDLVSLQKASLKLTALLAAQTVDIEDVVTDFKAARASARKPVARTIPHTAAHTPRRTKKLIAA